MILRNVFNGCQFVLGFSYGLWDIPRIRTLAYNYTLRVYVGDRRLVEKAAPTREKQVKDQEELKTSKKETANTKCTGTDVSATKGKTSAVTTKSVTQAKESANVVDNVTKKEQKKERDGPEKSKKKKSLGGGKDDDDGDESELARAVRAALAGQKRRTGKPKPPSRPPPWVCS